MINIFAKMKQIKSQKNHRGFIHIPSFFSKKKLICGFSLIEVLIVISIIVLLSGFTFFAITNTNKDRILSNDAFQAVSLLDRARSSTLSANDDSQYGVHFDQAQGVVILFKGATYVSNDPNNYNFTLNSQVQISSIALGGGSDVIFARLTGATSTTGTITFQSKEDLSKTKIVTISATGVSSSN